MKIIFSRHSRKRAKERGIKLQDIRRLMESPFKQFEAVEDGNVLAKGKINGKTFVVIFEDQKEIKKIVTVYYED